MARRRTAPASHASTIGQVRQADVIRFVILSARARGVPVAEIPVSATMHAQVAHRFPEAPPHVIQAALDAAAKAAERAVKQRDRGPGGKMTTREVGATERGCNQWRYHLLIRWADEDNGTHGVLPFAVQTASAQTNEQLAVAARNAVVQAAGRASAHGPNYDVTEGAVETEHELISVERACP